MRDPGYPYAETDDLRSGPDLHPALLSLLPLVGRWRGTGTVEYSTIETREYAQELRFSHDGRPFLAYRSRSWIIDADGRPVRPAAREVGWWRPRPEDSVEVLLAHPTGIVEIYYGRVEGARFELATDAVVRTASAKEVTASTRFELATDAVVRTASAKEVTASTRLYGIVDGALLYRVDMAAVGQPRQSHLAARLVRA